MSRTPTTNRVGKSLKYHVFIERCQDASAGATQRLAEAIAHRYGLPAAGIQQRMAAGRFRVKSDVDFDTATRFATDLESLGAVCTLLEAGISAADSQAAQKLKAAPTLAAPAAAAAAAPAAPAAPRPAAPAPAAPAPAAPAPAPGPTPSAMTSALAAARADAGSAPPPASSALSAARSDAGSAAAPASSALSAARASTEEPAASAAEFETGLSAAFSSGESTSETDLGALMGEDSGTFAIASLDGDEPEQPPRVAAATTSDEAADIGAGAADMFAPPEESTKELSLTLAVERPEPVAVHEPSAGSADAGLHAVEALPPIGAAEPPPEAATRKKLGNPLVYVASHKRAHLVAGVMTAVLLGFLPAHLVAGCQRDSKFSAIDKNVQAEYAEVKTTDDWDALDDMLTAQRTAKESAQANVAVTGFGAWLVMGGLLGFVWFRKIDWDRFSE